MRVILIIVRKEFLQIFRNKTMLPLIFVMPLVQLLILSNAANFEIKHLKVDIQDFDQTPVSRGLIGHITASPYFDLVHATHSEKDIQTDLYRNAVDLVVKIPANFERNLVRHNSAQVQLLLNAINGSAATVSYAYVQSIIGDYNKQIIVERPSLPSGAMPKGFDVAVSYWFNPSMDYKTFMVPGILVMLVTMVGMFLSGMNIVREKEIGTIEQLNVTPIRKYQFIIGKLLPFWILGLFELAFGLLAGKIAFHIPIVGSLWVIFLFAAIYLLVILGIGLFVSTITDTQQQAMFISWFFMVIFILMSGLFTPIESMPAWAQVITRFNPIAYFVTVMRLVMLKGATFSDIRFHFLVVLAASFIMLGLATWRYRKVAG